MNSRQVNRRGQGERLRADLLSATRKLADQLGSTEKLSIRAVAKEVGVAAPSVYLHFPNRDEMFRAAVAEDYEALAAQLRAASGTSADPLQRLRVIGYAYCRFATESPGRYRLITEVQQALPEGDIRPDRHPAAAVQAILLSAIEECQKGSSIETDPELVLTCLWSGWHGFIELRRSKPQREWPEISEVVDRFVDSLLASTGAQ